MKPIMKQHKRRKEFYGKLLLARHYEIISSLDISLAVLLQDEKTIAAIVKQFIANKYTIEQTIRAAFAITCINPDFYYAGQYLASINLVMNRICGIDIQPKMRYSEVMKLKGKLDHRIIRHALDFGFATKENRCAAFTENYTEYYHESTTM